MGKRPLGSLHHARGIYAEIERRAALMESDTATFAASLLQSALNIPRPAPKLTEERLEEFFRELAQFSHKIPLLPDEAFTRESIYRDHD